jgi:outer membrane protein OmpA-like peptidoglycan-associated protein
MQKGHKIVISLLLGVILLSFFIFIAPKLYYFITTNYRNVNPKFISAKVKEISTQVESKTTTIRTQMGKSLLNSKEIGVTVYFEMNASKLTKEAENELQKIVTFCIKNPTAKLRVFGFTDKTGTDSINIPLSIQRATAVKQYLENNGCKIENDIGYGSSEDSRKVTVTASK